MWEGPASIGQAGDRHGSGVGRTRPRGSCLSNAKLHCQTQDPGTSEGRTRLGPALALVPRVPAGPGRGVGGGGTCDHMEARGFCACHRFAVPSTAAVALLLPHPVSPSAKTVPSVPTGGGSAVWGFGESCSLRPTPSSPLHTAAGPHTRADGVRDQRARRRSLKTTTAQSLQLLPSERGNVSSSLIVRCVQGLWPLAPFQTSKLVPRTQRGVDKPREIIVVFSWPYKFPGKWRC